MKRYYFVFIFLFLFTINVNAQFFSFGRNKVQYTEFNWHILKTEHFDIYYYPEMESLANYGAYFAEESYKLLEQKFNHNVANRIPLVFYSSHLHFEQTNTTSGFIPDGCRWIFDFKRARGNLSMAFAGLSTLFATNLCTYLRIVSAAFT